MLFLEKIKKSDKKHGLTNLVLQTRSRLKRASANISQASLTVEAALVVPIFLFAVLYILSFIDIFKVQAELDAALHQTAKEMAIHAYKEETRTGLSVGYAYIKVVNHIGSDRLAKMPIKNGVAGISFFNSSTTRNECIDLIADYEAEPFFNLLVTPELHLASRCLIRGFTGFDNTSVTDITAADEQIVYITESGTVYHTNYNCSALSVSVSCVSKQQLGEKRNIDGEIYRSCPYCSKNQSGVVYITNYGNKYHNSILCSALKRSIIAIPLSQVQGRRACLRCGA